MNKSDKIFTSVVLILATSLFFTFNYFSSLVNSSNAVAIVKYKDKEVLRIDLKQDKNYEIEGTLGKVAIEVKEGKVRVEKENSPYHLCSIQGWVNKAYTPIVCLPNDVVITIVGADNDDDLIDTVIK